MDLQHEEIPIVSSAYLPLVLLGHRPSIYTYKRANGVEVPHREHTRVM
jgi:hypothetical protein